MHEILLFFFFLLFHHIQFIFKFLLTFCHIDIIFYSFNENITFKMKIFLIRGILILLACYVSRITTYRNRIYMICIRYSCVHITQLCQRYTNNSYTKNHHHKLLINRCHLSIIVYLNCPCYLNVTSLLCISFNKNLQHYVCTRNTFVEVFNGL